MAASNASNGADSLLPREDIAIIGMACVFPSAPNLQAYWENIVASVDAITDPPDDWGPEYVYDPTSSENDRIYCRRGGFLGDLARFNPMEFGVMPRSVDGGEPDHYLALQLARDALHDAGYVDPEKRPPGERVEIILGRGTYINRGWTTLAQHGLVVDQTLEILKQLHPEYSADELQAIRRELKGSLPPFNAETAPGIVPNIISGRIANRLDFMGPNFIVDAACASSLIATELGVRDLLIGKCDMALVGGIQASTPPPLFMIFCQLRALSRRGQVRAFDKDADGTLLGEGGGIIVLKRLANAERAGDRIYAVIKGTGTASDGRGVAVLTPRLEGQVLALQGAYKAAGISPSTIELIEAHGTGTPVGDMTEIQTLHQVFGPRQGPYPSVAVGSVKSMISHLIPAAGIAGLIKTALALYHGVLPPTLHCDEPNPKFELENTPFYINTETRPWIHGASDYPRRAGVNAFGFGGINAHVILEQHTGVEAEKRVSLMQHWDSEVFILEGDSRASLIEQGRQLQQYLSDAPPVALKDLAYTLNTDLGEKPYRLAIVASSLEDLEMKLERALERLADPQRTQIKDRSGIYFFAQPLGRESKLAFLFPGEGSQYVNMLHDLCLHFPEVRACFDEMDRVFARHGRGYVPSDFIFPRPAFSEAERKAAERRLWQMDVAIEGLLTANHALYTLLNRLGIRPDVMLGHSTGEYSAMRATGVLDEECYDQRLLELNRLYEDVAAEGDIPEATLLAVGADRDQVAAIVEEVGGDLYIAMDNCPHQVILVGSEEAANRALERVRRQGFIYEILSFDRAYHTPLFAPYAEVLREFLAGWIVALPRVPLYSCTTSAPYPADTSTLRQAQDTAGLSTSLAEIRRIAFDHWVRPVEFRQTVEAMYADGVRIFVEVGPRGNLTAFVDDILRTRLHLAVAPDVPSRSGITQLNHVVALLAAHGVPMRLDYLYERRAPRKLSPEAAVDRVTMQGDAGKAMKLALGLPVMRLKPSRSTEATGVRHAETQTSRAVDSPTSSPVLPPTVHAADQRSGSERPAQSGPSSPAIPPSNERHMADSALLAEVEGRRPSPQVVQSALTARLPDSGSLVLQEYLRTMERFLEIQQDVMRAYLVGDGVRAVSGVAGLSPDAAAPPRLAPAIEEQQPSPASSGPGPPSRTVTRGELQHPEPSSEGVAFLDAEAIGQILLRLVSERTGYPTEMLDLNLDLEADLGIDSIKRVEIFGAFQRETEIRLGEEMEQLATRRTLQGVIDFLAEHQAEAPDSQSAPPARAPEVASASTDHPPFPFVEKVVSLTPGEALVAQCEINLNTCPFLRDHTLGRQVSLTDPEFTGLPIVPLTMSMEMMAEAAAVLMPGWRLVGMKEVRAYRWIALDEGSLTLQLIARRLPSEREVHVQIREAEVADGPSGAPATPIVEGIMVFAEAYPEPPVVGAFALRQERPSKWSPERLYEEAMFHGPAFRGVRSMEHVGTDGAEATLEVLPLEGLFAPGADRTLLTDPILLDQPGQVVGFWAAQLLEEKHMIFPFRLEALHLFGPLLPPHEQVTCQARIALIGEQQVRSILDIVRADGRVWARFVGWEDRRFDLSWTFFHFMLSPRDVVVSQPWATPVASLPGSEGFQAYRLSSDAFPEGFFTAHSGIWRRVLVHLVLSRRERELWRSLRTPEPRRLEWLLGRVVAKDAVRQHLKQRYSLILCPADIEILPDGDGRPVAQGPWTDQVACVPMLSLSHAAGMAVAVVGNGDAGTGVGVDIEHVGRMNEDVEKLAFTPQERELLSAEKDGWRLRFWCAKEAVAKALGQGMVGGPQALVVQALDAHSGRVEVSLSAELPRQAREADGLTLTAFTAREVDLIVATSLCRSEGRMERHEERS